MPEAPDKWGIRVAALCAWGALASPAGVSAEAPPPEPRQETQARPEEAVESTPQRAPLCTESKLRLVGAIAASVNSFALVRAPAGTALLSPGERLNGHELLIVGAHQALMRDPTGDPCRLLLYHRSDADKVKSRSSRAAKAKARAKARRARRRRKNRKQRNR